MRHTLLGRTAPPVSPLSLADQLITLAERAGQAGYQDAAHRLVTLACQMLEQPPLPDPIINAARPDVAARRRYRLPGSARLPGH